LRWSPCFVPMLLLLALPSLTPSKQGVIVTAVLCRVREKLTQPSHYHTHSYLRLRSIAITAVIVRERGNALRGG
jgi:hypothetical protein